MRLPFQRDPQRDPRGSSDPAPRGVAESGEDAVAAARTSARRRLIGAAILLVAGVAGFPLLFDTEPRPLPANLPIVTAQNETVRAAAAPTRAAPMRAPDSATPASPAPAQAPVEATAAPASAPASHATPSAEARAASSVPSMPSAASRASAVPSAVATAPAAPSAPVRASAPASEKPSTPAAAVASGVRPSVPAAPSAPPAASRVAVTAPAAPAPPAKPAPQRPAEATTADGRFVVQVGAYSDAAMLRETRQKVEKLGLKTYTQVIEGDAGKRTRVRVGPFGTRAEAQAAVAKLKAAGLPANLLTL